MDSKLKKENEKKKRYLRQYMHALRMERELDEEIQQLRIDKMLPGIKQQDGMPHASGCKDLSGYAAKLDDLERELNEQKRKRRELRAEINRKVDEMENQTEGALLRYRYMQGMSFDEVGMKLSYSRRHTIRMHGDALIHFKM